VVLQRLDQLDRLLLHADGRRIQALFMRPYAMYPPEAQKQLDMLYAGLEATP